LRYETVVGAVFQKSQFSSLLLIFKDSFWAVGKVLKKEKRDFCLAQSFLKKRPLVFQNTFLMRRKILCPNTYFSVRTEQGTVS